MAALAALRLQAEEACPDLIAGEPRAHFGRAYTYDPRRSLPAAHGMPAFWVALEGLEELERLRRLDDEALAADPMRLHALLYKVAAEWLGSQSPVRWAPGEEPWSDPCWLAETASRAIAGWQRGGLRLELHLSEILGPGPYLAHRITSSGSAEAPRHRYMVLAPGQALEEGVGSRWVSAQAVCQQIGSQPAVRLRLRNPYDEISFGPEARMVVLLVCLRRYLAQRCRGALTAATLEVARAFFAEGGDSALLAEQVEKTLLAHGSESLSRQAAQQVRQATGDAALWEAGRFVRLRAPQPPGDDDT